MTNIDKKLNEIGNLVLDLTHDVRYLKQAQDKLKFKFECIRLLGSSIKEMEQELGIKIRNGNTSTAIKKTLMWILTHK